MFFYFGGLTENLAKQDDKHFFDKLHRTVLATLLCQPRQGASELYTSRLRALLEQAAFFADTEADTPMHGHDSTLNISLWETQGCTPQATQVLGACLLPPVVEVPLLHPHLPIDGAPEAVVQNIKVWTPFR